MAFGAYNISNQLLLSSTGGLEASDLPTAQNLHVGVKYVYKGCQRFDTLGSGDGLAINYTNQVDLFMDNKYKKN